jgi:hypothetical protein
LTAAGYLASACHIGGMAKNEHNFANLEANLRGLYPGHRLLTNDGVLTAVFGPDVVAAVESAKELAERNNCSLEYNLEQGSGFFRRSNS